MQQLKHQQWPSINALSKPLLESLILNADVLRLGIDTLSNGTTLVDAGIEVPGGLEAGRRIAEICLGGLGSVTLHMGSGSWPLFVNVHTANPVLACMGSQYAGWRLSHDEGGQAFHALGSGPGRALAGKEELFQQINYRDQASTTCFILEVDRNPPMEIINRVAQDCGVAPDGLTFILTPTKSLAGMLQITSRVLEVALHKVHALGFPLENIVDGAGRAPLPPPAKDFLTCMGRSNDAILFGGSVQLYVDGSDEDARDLAEKLPASTSRDYSKSFAQIFKEVDFDFYRIDPMLFAPAEVIVSTLKGGKTFRAGAVNAALIDSSFS